MEVWLANIAGWIALVATCIAALMTASNLGARVTGWGFVVFTIGALAWIVVGVTTEQTQLLYSNIFLGLVDLFGIWRWLGHRARISDTSQSEEARSERTIGEELFSIATLDGMPLRNKDGEQCAIIADAMAGCESGQLQYLIIRAGGVAGVGETLHRLPWTEVCVDDGKARTSLSALAIKQLSLATP